jgi:hypothetical protein
MSMHDDCEMRDEFQRQAARHHQAMNDISKTMGGMQVSIETILGHLVGTFSTPGIAHRLTSLEAKQRTSWWSERGTKVVDALILGIVVSGLVLLLKLGFQGAIRQEIQNARDDLSMAIQSRKAPKDPTCPGCSPAVAAAE